MKTLISDTLDKFLIISLFVIVYFFLGIFLYYLHYEKCLKYKAIISSYIKRSFFFIVLRCTLWNLVLYVKYLIFFFKRFYNFYFYNFYFYNFYLYNFYFYNFYLYNFYRLYRLFNFLKFFHSLFKTFLIYNYEFFSYYYLLVFQLNCWQYVLLFILLINSLEGCEIFFFFNLVFDLKSFIKNFYDYILMYEEWLYFDFFFKKLILNKKPFYVTFLDFIINFIINLRLFLIIFYKFVIIFIIYLYDRNVFILLRFFYFLPYLLLKLYWRLRFSNRIAIIIHFIILNIFLSFDDIIFVTFVFRLFKPNQRRSYFLGQLLIFIIYITCYILSFWYGLYYYILWESFNLEINFATIVYINP